MPVLELALAFTARCPRLRRFQRTRSASGLPSLFFSSKWDHNGRWIGFNAAQNDAFLKKKEDQLNRCPAGSYDVILKSPGLVHGSFSEYPYIEAFLDQTLNQKSSPLLENAVDHPAATVKGYGH